jgi:sugar/nucleoside kinase (ribokinase family)
MSRPLLIVGHATRDEFPGEPARLGGSASFAARVAALLDVPAAVVTAGPTSDPLLAPLRALPGVALHLRPSPTLTGFALDYTGGRRRLVLVSRAPALTADDVAPFVAPGALDTGAAPGAPDAGTARLAYVVPVAGECPRPLLERLSVPGGPAIALGLQGWLRRLSVGQEVAPALDEAALFPPVAGARVAIFSELDHPDAEAIAARLAGHGLLVALTRAAAGATLLTGALRIHVAAEPAVVRDETGAGDVFGLVLALALAGGAAVPTAGALAAAAAAHVIEGPGVGTLDRFDRRRLAPFVTALAR